ncbi:nickel/cobalt ABC transporter permease [Serratia fonticola]|uniref:nickel/cobalt ABC transporter permease n=1 Tax=Serratia fonticola TaxID=47917 RepID=UPI001AE3D16C|nr:nickel/cobalt ABC transporter permease [Serratia fonticola]MBP0997905.1 ABC transporter permease subunit [Serratia fonticola]MBP1003832.1 ABC transporter permease subunit [Serratia fonticola]MBP1013311.1 ABC transporter permease subunit [Serratia fonticola]
MRQYFVRRLLMMIPLAILISFIAFALMNLTPSDPAEVALRINEVVPTPQAIAGMRQELGLDAPFLQRYFSWLQHALQLDFGRSFLTRTPVFEEILAVLPATLWLAATALTFIVLISLSLSLVCVLTQNGYLDRGIRAVMFVLTAIPGYWMGLLLIWTLAVKMDWFPVSGMQSPHAIILPALTLSLGYIGTYLRLIRGTMLSQLQQPYVFYARARGLSERRILLRHVLPNSLHTSLIAIGISIPKLIAGTVVVESIFAWPGIGRLCINAIFGRDYPIIQAYIFLMALLFLFFNFISDLLQQYLDPRLIR